MYFCMTSLISLFGLIALTLFATACTPKAPGDVVGKTFKGLNASHHCIDTAKGTRCYYLVLPNEMPSKLIVALHPAFHSVAATEEVARFAPKAIEAGYGVMFPEGIDKQWNDGRIAEKATPYAEKYDDVAFLNAAIAQVQKQLQITPRDTLIAGMSNGGMMAQRLACESDIAHAMVTVVANLPVGLDTTCTASPKAMLMVFGKADSVVPYAGGALGKTPTAWGEVISTEDTIAFFAKRNGANAAPTITQLNAQEDKTIAEHRVFTDASPRIEAYVVENMGHTWPNESSQLRAWLTTRGRVTREIDAVDEILRFAEDTIGTSNAPPRY